MATSFPTSLDSLTNPTSTDTTTAVDHAAQHANANDAIEALQTKVGINSSAVTSTHDYKLSEVTSTDKAVGKTATQTLTNKRITVRSSSSTANSATPSINTDNADIFIITGQTNNITSMTSGLSGTPTEGQTLWLAMTAGSGTPTITWGSSFEASSLSLPTGLTTQRQDFRFVWNSTTSKWRFIGFA